MDDVVFMGQWNSNNIDTIIHVLKCFHLASGLNINLGKSMLIGIAVNDVYVQQAVNKIGCGVLHTPFTYLGSKVGGGRLTLLKAVLGAMSIYHMSIFKVPMKVLHCMESIRSRFINGVELNCKKAIWVKWCNVLASTEKGGLGKKIGSGKDTFFRDDVWLGDTPLKYRFPRVYSLEVNKHVDVASKMSQVNLSASLRRCPRGGVEQSQMGELIALLNDVVLGVMDDRWCWALDGLGEFSVASVRKSLDALWLSCVSS
nr:RNA-directed DNA polymerase, eukaryota, reverse transcriptase zinc-binding domain protein [Tanacetum cinerariifolium]